MAYDAYQQFVVAAQRFPRWTNIRRRPTESNGGKILRSLIEELSNVETAIIEYKKDFFLANYQDRANEIIDYIYIAQVGQIENLHNLSLVDSLYTVTDDKEAFYEDRFLVYYENGYLVTYEPVEYISGTQPVQTSKLIGNTESKSLYNGKMINYYLPYEANGEITLNLALEGETLTGPIKVKFVDESTEHRANTILAMTYHEADNTWHCGAYWDKIDSSQQDTRLAYIYNGYQYKASIEKEAIWNIYDEFAWWCGLERLDGEHNATLMERCFDQYQRRPNSTKQGIKNCILNIANAKTDLIDNVKEDRFIKDLTEEEIQILEPNEKTLSELNNDGISFYEEISRFNRDIARTRQWDIDYWDNAFRKLRYIPHVWDAKVDVYKNGVGYNDSLLVSNAEELNFDETVNVTVNGYVYSYADVQQYIADHNITKQIPLKFTRYGNTIKPTGVQYKITAESLIPVTEPEQIRFDFYKGRVGRDEYYLDEFVTKTDGGITKANLGDLSSNNRYRLSFTAVNNGLSTMEIDYCKLLSSNKEPQNLLVERSPFKLQNNRLVNTNVYIHAENVYDVAAVNNFQTNINGGLELINPLARGSFEIPLGDTLQNGNKALLVPISGGYEKITFNPIFVEQSGFTKIENGYISSDDLEFEDVLTITAPCKDLTFQMEAENSTAVADIEVLVDGAKHAKSNSRQIVRNYTFNLKLDGVHDVVVTIKRQREACKIPFTIKNISRSSYEVNMDLNGRKVPYKEGMTMYLNRSDARALTFTLKNYTSVSPIIEYIHIGAQLRDVTYDIDFDTNETVEPKLQISTNCLVTLQNLTTGETINQYHTHDVYTNTSDAAQYIFLDFASFNKLYETVPETKRTAINGMAAYRLTIPSHKSLSTITISGDGYKLLTTRNLKELLNITDINQKLYLSRTLECFVIVNNNDNIRKTLAYNELGFGNRVVISSTSFHDFQPCFITNVDQNRSILTNDYAGTFEYMFLYPGSVSQYISYNFSNAIQQNTEVELANNFDPDLPVNELLVYTIENTTPQNGVTVLFKDGTQQSIGKQNIEITVDAYGVITNNPNIVESNSIQLSQRFLLSNVIPLASTLDWNGNPLTPEILAKYIIEVPSNMTLHKEPAAREKVQTTYEDGGTMYVENDGFTKLEFSNVTRIVSIKLNGVNVTSGYTLLGKEGIISWTNDAYKGRIINEIVYTYEIPTSIRFNNISDIYDVVGYKVDAMRNVNKMKYEVKGLKNGDTFKLDYDGYFQINDRDNNIPDYISVSCPNNPYFSASIQKDIVTIKKIAETTEPIIHNGYYYVDGDEYYYFSDMYDDKEKKVDGIDIINGEIINGVLFTRQDAINFLRNSKMNRNTMDVHCVVDFNYYRNNTNKEPLKHIGACESFAAWHDYNIRRALTVYKNGYAMQFISKENGYSLLDITQALTNHTTVSCLFTGRLRFALAKEIYVAKQQALKSVFCQKIQNFEIKDDIAYCIPESIDTNNYRYYLVVEGNGVLDEVLVHNSTEIAQIKKEHVKGIDMLGFTIKEKEVAERTTDIEYSSDYMTYVGLETGVDGILRTGTTADWNITKLLTVELDSVKKQKFLYRNGVLIAQANDAIIETNPIELDYLSSIQTVAFKINDLVEGPFKNFTIKVFTSKSKAGTYTELRSVTQENVITYNPNDDSNFVKFQIIAQEGQIIRNLDLFVIYKENQEEKLAIYYNDKGSAVTKIYDIGAVGTYKFHSVLSKDGKTWGTIYVRGAKESINEELVWTGWTDVELHPDFENCQLFQFKIVLDNSKQYAKIDGFRFSVLARG